MLTTMPHNTKSVLDPLVHARLIQDKDHISQMAGIAPKFIDQTMKGIAMAPEINWVKNFNSEREKHAGLVFQNASNVSERMMAVCGALIRNFIDARFVTLNDLIENRDVTAATVILVPNLHMQAFGGKTLTSWQIQVVYDILMKRIANSKQTVVAIASMDGIGNDYGSTFRDLLEHSFKKVEH